MVDTTAIIDLWRHRRAEYRLVEVRQKIGSNPVISHQVLYEYARGALYRGVAKEKVARFLADFKILEQSEEQSYRAAQIDADLRKRGTTVGPGDIWIAAVALEKDLPVLTANVKDFSKIPGVVVVEYKILPE